MQEFTAAAVQVQSIAQPLSAESIAANVLHCVEWVRRCVGDCGADLVVLPETCTTGFGPGCGPTELGRLVGRLATDPDSAAATAPFNALAADLGIHLVYGAYEAGSEEGVVYNSAVLVHPDGTTAAVYHKTHPYCTEIVTGGGWVTPGDDACVVDTALGRIGLMICFDGDYPELSRISAIQGAQVVVRPSALLRSADIWELTNRARAYDNHVFIVGSNATGKDPAGTLYFGNSMIVTPTAEVVARGSSYEQWVSARLDPATAMKSLTPGSSVAQGFDHLADRNLALISKHLDTLARPARTSFPYERSFNAGSDDE